MATDTIEEVIRASSALAGAGRPSRVVPLLVRAFKGLTGFATAL